MVNHFYPLIPGVRWMTEIEDRCLSSHESCNCLGV